MVGPLSPESHFLFQMLWEAAEGIPEVALNLLTPLTHQLLCEIKEPRLGRGLERWFAGTGPEHSETLTVQENRLFSKTQKEILDFREAGYLFLRHGAVPKVDLSLKSRSAHPSS